MTYAGTGTKTPTSQDGIVPRTMSGHMRDVRVLKGSASSAEIERFMKGLTLAELQRIAALANAEQYKRVRRRKGADQ